MNSWTDRLIRWQKYEYTGMRPGLARMRRFLETAGNPQRSFKAIHIAGTNGKGSTARMLADIFEASGYKTGLYTSPHLVRIHERIQVNSLPIPGSKLENLTRRYAPIAKKYGLTFFEFVTGIAFAYFADEKIDVAVIETGLGGRFDATNVIDAPELSIITDVDYDHRQILGRTLGKIAYEKAGIIKRGRPVISGASRPVAGSVIRKIARRNGSSIREYNRDFVANPKQVQWKKGTQTLEWRKNTGVQIFTLSLLGVHQVKNCAVALAAIGKLEESGWRTSRAAVERALACVTWPGRFDVRHASANGKQTTIVLDGAHNPDGVRRFVETWKMSPWGKKKRTFVFGVLADKEYGAMVRMLAPLAGRVVIVPAATSRNADGREVAKQWGKFPGIERIEIAGSVREGLRSGLRDGVCAVTGSLYVIGEAIRELGEITKHERRG